MTWPAKSQFNRKRPPHKKPLGEIAVTRAGFDLKSRIDRAKELEREATKLLSRRMRGA